MIIQTPESTVQTSGKMRTKGFNMKASAKGFRIISTTLYKDPILAIVRELTCNSWDAHQMNKNFDTPVQVHLPNQFEPWFSVKDCGCGMSDDEIFGVYTTVFDSTKDDSNDVIGAMGLGSKTPFSYNNGQSFTVKSVKNGLKSVYSAYLDRGEPAITCMSEPAPTDESDGVEVIVPVRKEDFSRFKQAARDVVPYFVSPAIETNMQLDTPKFEYSDGYFTKTRNGWGNMKVYAVMGNVCYPLNGQYINDLNVTMSYFRNVDLYVNFNIGDLDVSASREELHYDDRTIANINKSVVEINEKFIVESQKWLDEQKFTHIGHAWRAANDRFDSAIMKKLKFGDVDVTQYAHDLTKNLTDQLGVNVVKFKRNHANKEGVQRVTVQRVADVLSPHSNYEKHPITIVKDDLKTGGVGIMKEYVRKTSNNVYYYHEGKPSTKTIMPLLERLRDCEYNVLLTSDLKANYTPEKKKVAKGTYTPTVNLFRMYFDEDGGRCVDACSVDKSVLREDNIHFVSIFRDDVERKPGNESGMQYREALTLIENVMTMKGIEEVYIARRPEYKYIAENKNAVNIFDLQFTKREARSMINWKAYTIGNNMNGWRANLSRTWSNRAVREHFKFGRSGIYDNHAVDVLAHEFKTIAEVRSIEEEKHLKKLIEIENNPKYKLLFNLVGSSTQTEDAQQLIKLLRGKRNG